MSLRFIPGIKYPVWLWENKKLRKTALACAGLGSAALLVYFLALAPSVSHLRDIEGRYAELRKKHTEALLFQKQKNLFAGFLAGIPTQKDMPLLVKDLVQTARRLKLSVAGINYDIPRRGNNEITMLSFPFPAEGSYPDIKRFIYEIETSDRLVGIQGLKFEAAEHGRVKLQMKLVTYIKGETPAP